MRAFYSVLFLFLAQAVSTDRPAVLVELAQQRKDWKGLRVRWVVRNSEVGATPRFYETHSVGQETIVIFYGDAEGVISRDAAGRPNDNGFGPVYNLVRPGESWVRQEGMLHADVTERAGVDGAVINFRSFGLSYARAHSDVERTLWADHLALPKPREYEQRADGDKLIITARTDAGDISWTLDTARGNQPTSVQLRKSGRVLQETRSVLGQLADGSWYPTRVEMFRNTYRGGKEPYEVIEVVDLEPNPPDLPTRLTPADIRVDTGLNIVQRRADGTPLPGLMKWDGQLAVPLEEYNARFRSGELRSGPIFQADFARAQELDKLHRQRMADEVAEEVSGGNPKRRRSPFFMIESEWERYTRLFIDRYRLDGDQTQRALLILADAERLGRSYVQKQQADFEKYDKMALTSQPTKEDQEQLKQTREALMRPLDGIFDEILKRRLEALPTRAQRQQVEAARPK